MGITDDFMRDNPTISLQVVNYVNAKRKHSEMLAAPLADPSGRELELMNARVASQAELLADLLADLVQVGDHAR